MKRCILPLFLALSLLLSLMTVTALAVPDVTGNVGDDNGVVTTAGNGTTATSPVTLPTTVAPATTAPTTTPTTTAPTTLPTTTAPTTTGTGDMADEGNAGRVIGIILAILIAAAIVVLVVLLLPRMRDRKGDR